MMPSNLPPGVTDAMIERQFAAASEWDEFDLGKDPVFCTVCGRELTDLISIQRQIGPECLRKMEATDSME